MLDEETYEKELVRMWDSLRTDSENKGYYGCADVICKKCPLYHIGCREPMNTFKIIDAVEKWSKEHPQKHKVSKLEYDILDAYTNLFDFGGVKMLNFSLFDRLHEIGYFKGVTKDMYIKDYFKNCEVTDNDG